MRKEALDFDAVDMLLFFIMGSALTMLIYLIEMLWLSGVKPPF